MDGYELPAARIILAAFNARGFVMIRSGCVAAIAAILGMLSVSAVADDSLTTHFYVGGDYEYLKLNYKTIDGIDVGTVLDDSLNGLSPHIGATFGQYVGIELGYLWSLGGSRTIGSVTTNVKVSGPTFDGMIYIPVKSGDFRFVGTIGLSDYTGKATTVIGTTNYYSDRTERGFRAGGGAEYTFTPHVSGRVLIRYQSADFDGLLNNTILTTAGLNFRF